MTPSLSRWEDLLGEAFTIVDAVNSASTILDCWTFGGGTALMLQIEHRESHDVDLFVEDPQLLPYIEAAVADLRFGVGAPTYDGDGRGHLKIAFDGVGEIDFIVAGQVTAKPSQAHDILGRMVLLETVPEIIAKKIRFRGSRIQPRDIFDIAAAVEAGHGDDIRSVLSELPEDVSRTTMRLTALSPEYVETVISQLMIRPAYAGLVKRALPIARDALASL